MIKNDTPKKPATKAAAAMKSKEKLTAAKPSAAPLKSTPPKSRTITKKTKPTASQMNGHGGKTGQKADKPPIKTVKPRSVAKPAVAPKEKIKKIKLVRDSFTMPEAEYAGLGMVKKACLKAGFEVKKSELLRVGVALLQDIDVLKLKAILGNLPPLKAGRPKKEK
jgi:hypothetical protein